MDVEKDKRKQLKVLDYNLKERVIKAVAALSLDNKPLDKPHDYYLAEQE